MSSETYISPANKWVVAITVSFGAFMAVMDINIVNVSLPHMMGSFGQDMSAITWIATAYSIAELITVTMAGWLSTVLGRKKLYLLSFGLFILGSILCGTAQSFAQMIIYRIIQGVGGGTLIPVSQAILRETFPPDEQGMAMGVFGMGVVLAPAVGPILGGWLTDSYGWPWIFFVNIPICIAGIFMIISFVHDPPYLRRGIKKIDWIGLSLMAITLVTMQIVLERGQSENWFESNLIITGTIICILAGIALVLWELKTSEPIINFRLLKNSALTLGSLVGLLFGIGLYGTTFILPLFTQELLNYPAVDAGLVLSPRAFMLAIFMPLTGWLYKHVDARVLMLPGALIVYWSCYDLAHLSLNAGFWTLVPILLAMGIGMPFVFVTTITVALSTISREDMTDAAAIYTLSRRIGGNIAYAIIATIVARGTQIHRTYMIEHISSLSSNFLNFQSETLQKMYHMGVNPASAKQAFYALTNSIINRQSAMMAYNDASFALGYLFLASIPFILLLPSRAKIFKKIDKISNK